MTEAKQSDIDAFIERAGRRKARLSEPRQWCCYCDGGSELRPYGPSGARVCFPCATSTPERNAETNRQIAAQWSAALSVRPAAIELGPDGPQPFAASRAN